MVLSTLKYIFYGIGVPLYAWEVWEYVRRLIEGFGVIKGGLFSAVLLIAACFRVWYMIHRDRKKLREQELRNKELELKIRELENNMSDPTTKAYY